VFGYRPIEVIAFDDRYATPVRLADAVGERGFSHASRAIDAHEQTSAPAPLI
jgi:hypothetical protein